MLNILPLALLAPAHATTWLRPLDILDLADRAERVVVGEVMASYTVVEDDGWWTVAEIYVHENLRGPEAPVLRVRWPGGSIDGIDLVVAGTPHVYEGERVAVFAGPNDRVVGFSQGLFDLAPDGWLSRDISDLSFVDDGPHTERLRLDELRSLLAGSP